MYTISVFKDNINIENSYQVESTEEMNLILDGIRGEHTTKECAVLERSNESLIREWRSHNLLYNLHILRSHTKDVDLDTNTTWYFNIGYRILSFLYI